MEKIIKKINNQRVASLRNEVIGLLRNIEKDDDKLARNGRVGITAFESEKDILRMPLKQLKTVKTKLEGTVIYAKTLLYEEGLGKKPSSSKFFDLHKEQD